MSWPVECPKPQRAPSSEARQWLHGGEGLRGESQQTEQQCGMAGGGSMGTEAWRCTGRGRG